MTPPGDTTPVVVYTCITDDYDWLLPPLFTRADVRYICFTDRPRIRSRGWELRSIDPSLRGLPPT